MERGGLDLSLLVNDLRIRFFNAFSIEMGMSFIPSLYPKLGINFHIYDFSISMLGISTGGGIWFGYLPIKSQNKYDFFSRIGFLRNRSTKEDIYNTIALEFGVKYNIN